VRRNENQNEVRIEGEVDCEGEIGEIINIADDKGQKARGTSDFRARRR
jgi:hypothetical protein